MGHELALKFLLVGIKVLNYPKIIKYTDPKFRWFINSFKTDKKAFAAESW